MSSLVGLKRNMRPNVVMCLLRFRPGWLVTRDRSRVRVVCRRAGAVRTVPFVPFRFCSHSAQNGSSSSSHSVAGPNRVSRPVCRRRGAVRARGARSGLCLLGSNLARHRFRARVYDDEPRARSGLSILTDRPRTRPCIALRLAGCCGFPSSTRTWGRVCRRPSLTPTRHDRWLGFHFCPYYNRIY